MSTGRNKWCDLNADQIQRSIIMAKHLKEARKSKGLSQEEAASKAEISKAALANYEQETLETSKFGQNLGMAAETVCKLAELYGTNTDYLLGKEKAKSPDDKVLFTINFTGLSEDAVKQLHHQADKGYEDNDPRKYLINSILEDSRTYQNMAIAFETALSSYLEYKKQKDPQVVALETAWFNFNNTGGTVSKGDRIIPAKVVSETFIHQAAVTFEAILTDAMEKYRKQMEADAAADATEDAAE